MIGCYNFCSEFNLTFVPDLKRNFELLIYEKLDIYYHLLVVLNILFFAKWKPIFRWQNNRNSFRFLYLISFAIGFGGLPSKSIFKKLYVVKTKRDFSLESVYWFEVNDFVFIFLGLGLNKWFDLKLLIIFPPSSHR